MKLIIDERERKIIPLIRAMVLDLSLSIDIEVQTIPLGDFIIQTTPDNNDLSKDLIIIERKCLTDLASSIKDGRYMEQSHRLHNLPIHNHNVIYLIEGDFRYYSSKYTKVPTKTLYSTITSILLYKGFSVIKTIDIHETCEFILYMIDKLNKKNNIPFFFDLTSNPTSHTPSYTTVVKKTKKSNITPANIGEIILSQIPGVSSVTAISIMSHFKSLYDLLGTINHDQNCLNDITYTTKNGIERRISKKSKDNIIQYLLYQKTNIIKVDI